ncbi:MAG: methyltransferase domain-containing protein [Candidatus Eisenbacteria bacterium]
MKDNDLDEPTSGLVSARQEILALRPDPGRRGSELNPTLRSDTWRVVDTRPSLAFRNGHLPGSIHLSGESVKRHPYLLPPRRRRLCAVASTEETARSAAASLVGLGWHRAGYAVVPDPPPPSMGNVPLLTGPSDTVLWEPSSWLADIAPDLPTDGDALDFACGSGRDAVWLASLRKGTVHGVDLLPDALLRARALRSSARAALAARSAGAGGPHLSNVRFHQADLAREPGVSRWLPPSRWNVVLVFRYLDRGLLPRIAASLRPGGHLVYQTFLVEQRERKGSPRSDHHLLTPGELEAAFRSLEILRYQEGDDEDGNVFASLWARRPES